MVRSRAVPSPLEQLSPPAATRALLFPLSELASGFPPGACVSVGWNPSCVSSDLGPRFLLSLCPCPLPRHRRCQALYSPSAGPGNAAHAQHSKPDGELCLRMVRERRGHLEFKGTVLLAKLVFFFFPVEGLGSELSKIKWGFERGVPLVGRAEEPSCWWCRKRQEAPDGVLALCGSGCPYLWLLSDSGKTLLSLSDSASVSWGHRTRWSLSPCQCQWPCEPLFHLLFSPEIMVSRLCCVQNWKRGVLIPPGKGRESSEKVNEGSSRWLKFSGSSQRLCWIEVSLVAFSP